MADAGAIGTYRGDGIIGAATVIPDTRTKRPTLFAVRRLQVWGRGTAADYHQQPESGAISGRVLNVDASPAADKRVRFYDRATGILIGATVTDSNGDYRFDLLDPAVKVQVVALESGLRAVPDQNAVIADYLTPE